MGRWSDFIRRRWWIEDSGYVSSQPSSKTSSRKALLGVVVSAQPILSESESVALKSPKIIQGDRILVAMFRRDDYRCLRFVEFGLA
ncbi:hypothetical protein V6N13_083465 [Hibiscus sabdariffa]